MCEIAFVCAEQDRIALILDKVVLQLQGFAQNDHGSHESGGVMVGERRGSHFVVNSISVPQCTDVRGRFKFIRNIAGHDRFLETAFKKSKGTSNYLGEWHTHPEDQPKPSPQDIRSWKRNALRIKQDTLAIIQGRKGIYAALILRNGGVIEMRRSY